MPWRARSSAGVDVSCSSTSKPACANTWAMPWPIVPAPTTPTRRTSLPAWSRGSRGVGLRRLAHRSTASATPLPPPRHSAATPRFTCRRRIA